MDGFVIDRERTWVDARASSDHDDGAMGRGRDERTVDERTLQLDRRIVGVLSNTKERQVQIHRVPTAFG